MNRLELWMALDHDRVAFLVQFASLPLYEFWPSIFRLKSSSMVRCQFSHCWQGASLVPKDVPQYSAFQIDVFKDWLDVLPFYFAQPLAVFI